MSKKYAIFCKNSYTKNCITQIKKYRLLKDDDLYDRLDLLKILEITDYAWYKGIKTKSDNIFELKKYYIVIVEFKFACIVLKKLDYFFLSHKLKCIDYLNAYLNSLDTFISFKDFQNHIGLSKKVLYTKLNTTDYNLWFIKFNDFQVLEKPKIKSKIFFEKAELKPIPKKILIRLRNKSSNFFLNYLKEFNVNNIKDNNINNIKDIVTNKLISYRVKLLTYTYNYFISCLDLDSRGNWNIYRKKYRVDKKISWKNKRKFKRVFESHVFIKEDKLKALGLSSLIYNKEELMGLTVDPWKKKRYKKEYLDNLLDEFKKINLNFSIKDIRGVLKKDKDKKPRFKWLYQLYNFSELRLFNNLINIYPFLGLNNFNLLMLSSNIDISRLNYVLLKVLRLNITKEIFLKKGIEKTILWKLLHKNRVNIEDNKIQRLCYHGYPYTCLKENVLDIKESKKLGLDYSYWKLERLNYLKEYYKIDNDNMLLYFLINTLNLELPNPLPRLYPYKKNQRLRDPKSFYGSRFLLKKTLLTILLQNKNKELLYNIVQMINDSNKSLKYKDELISYLFSQLPLNRWGYISHYISDISLRHEVIKIS